jgi:hypothetical protein
MAIARLGGHQGSTGLSHVAQKKLLPPSDWITLNPSEMLSTCASHDNLSAAESCAVPVFRQLGHLSFSTQLSRTIQEYASRTFMFQVLRRHNQTDALHYPRLGWSIIRHP